MSGVQTVDQPSFDNLPVRVSNDTQTEMEKANAQQTSQQEKQKHDQKEAGEDKQQISGGEQELPTTKRSVCITV